MQLILKQMWRREFEFGSGNRLAGWTLKQTQLKLQLRQAGWCARGTQLSFAFLSADTPRAVMVPN